MATVAQVAKSSLQRILVQASEAPLEPDEYQDFIFTMNNYMAELDASGIQLGYTVVSNLGDDVTIPTGALRGLIANMAIEVAPDYNGVVSVGLAKAARDGFNTMRLVGQSMGRTRFPSTLPIGSGNEDNNFGISSNFYPNQESSILAETTGAIALEVSTNG
tara:strand:- start:12415 stop:12897 length:483 start_codon:yes stop_codon:yes gene_type:complete